VVSIGAGAGRNRSGWTELAPSADMPALVRVAAAFRADHLLIGETAGAELLDLLTAAARGQEGILVGLPARSAGEALARVEALAARSAGTGGVAPLVDSTLDLVVSAASLADGGVVVTEIAEPRLDSGKLGTERVAVWQPEGDGKRARGAAGKQQVTGVSPRLAASLASSGSPLPSSLVRSA
jgi:pilus assembly protein CpaF